MNKKPPLTFKLSDLRKRIHIPRKVQAVLIFTGWIGGLLLMASLCWFFTQPVRGRFLQRAVNRVLEQSGDPRRLGSPLVLAAPDSIMMGAYFTVANTGDTEAARACVFTFIAEGSFFPCAVLLSSEGKVLEFLPLNSHGERILRQISPGILEFYARRIEGTKS